MMLNLCCCRTGPADNNNESLSSPSLAHGDDGAVGNQNNNADAETENVKRKETEEEDADDNDNTWRCAKCTLINSKSNGRCAVCGGAKPLPEITNRNGNRNGSGRGEKICCHNITQHTPHVHRGNRSDPHPPLSMSSIAEEEEVGDAKQESESGNGIIVMEVTRSNEISVKYTDEETGETDEWVFDCKVIGGRVIKGMTRSNDIRGIVSQNRIKFEQREKQGNYIEIYEGTAISINNSNNTTNSLVTFNGTYKAISGGSESGSFEVTLPFRALQPQKPTTELRVTPLPSSSSSSSFSFLSFIDRNGDITGVGGGDAEREFVVDGRIDMWTNEITINKTVVGEEGKWEGGGKIIMEGETGHWKGVINEVGGGSERWEVTLPVEVARENRNEMDSRWTVWMMNRVPQGGAWMVVCNDKNNNNNRIDDPRNVILFCDLMAADEEEEEDEKVNKKEKGGFKVKDIGGKRKWRMHLPFQKMDGTEIIMNVHADDKWLVERIRSIVNGKKNTCHSDSKSDGETDGNKNNSEEQRNELFGGQFMVIEVRDEEDEDAKEQQPRVQPHCSCGEALEETTISFSSKCKYGCNKSLSENDIIWECPRRNNKKYHRNYIFMCNECAKETAKYQRSLSSSSSSSSSPPSFRYISLSGAQQLHFYHSYRSSAPSSKSLSIPNDVLSASIPIHSKCGWLMNRCLYALHLQLTGRKTLLLLSPTNNDRYALLMHLMFVRRFKMMPNDGWVRERMDSERIGGKQEVEEKLRERDEEEDDGDGDDENYDHNKNNEDEDEDDSGL